MQNPETTACVDVKAFTVENGTAVVRYDANDCEAFTTDTLASYTKPGPGGAVPPLSSRNSSTWRSVPTPGERSASICR